MKKLIKFLTKPILQKHFLQDMALAIPRIIYGYLLTSSFGSDKFGMPWTDHDKNLQLFEVAYWFPNDVADYGGVFALFPAFLAWMAGFSEAVGGLAWIVGFQTRIFSFLLICTTSVIVFVHQIQFGIWNMLPGLGIFWIALLSLIFGSGRFGIDYLLTKTNSK